MSSLTLSDETSGMELHSPSTSVEGVFGMGFGSLSLQAAAAAGACDQVEIGVAWT